ncbi:hypothetical protein BC6_00006 [Bacillus phage BC-6]|nr:hypothetical protein BC6_00006 [Bacillus phage BC-6]
MKFEKDVAKVKLYFYDGNTFNETYGEFKLNPKAFANRLMRDIDRGNQILFSDNFYDGEDIKSFEIVNYDELLERHLERMAEEDESEE